MKQHQKIKRHPTLAIFLILSWLKGNIVFNNALHISSERHVNNWSVYNKAIKQPKRIHKLFSSESPDDDSLVTSGIRDDDATDNLNAGRPLPMHNNKNQEFALDLLSSDSKASNAKTLQMIHQARSLREEVKALETKLALSKQAKKEKEIVRIDALIENLLVKYTSDDKEIQILNDADRVFERLRNDRYSPEQVRKVFKRLCDTSKQTRDNCSPLMSALIEGVGKMDSLEISDNPNKRWKQKLEMRFRKKLFQLEYGVDIEDEEDRNELSNRF